MLRLIPRTRRDDVNAADDVVMLADGQMVRVPRASLAAAKALLAAQKAAERRVAQMRAEAGENSVIASSEERREYSA